MLNMSGNLGRAQKTAVSIIPECSNSLRHDDTTNESQLENQSALLKQQASTCVNSKRHVKKPTAKEQQNSLQKLLTPVRQSNHKQHESNFSDLKSPLSGGKNLISSPIEQPRTISHSPFSNSSNSQVQKLVPGSKLKQTAAAADLKKEQQRVKEERDKRERSYDKRIQQFKESVHQKKSYVPIVSKLLNTSVNSSIVSLGQ